MLFIAVVLIACNKPIKEFTLSDGMTLQLFSDSTFSQDIRLLERKYNVSGTWTGSVLEGNSFTTTRSGNGLEKEVVTTYIIKNENAALVNTVKK